MKKGIGYNKVYKLFIESDKNIDMLKDKCKLD